MITPLFTANQNESFIIITMKMKYVKMSEMDVFIENNNFKFHLKPYFLNLFFSDNLKSDSLKNNSKYDVETGIFECYLEKEQTGTHFKDLEMLNTLMIKNEKSNDDKEICKKIQEISLNDNDNPIKEKIEINFTGDLIQDTNILNEILTNQIEQNYNKFEIEISNSKNFNYGFNNEFDDIFNHREEELIELSDLNPTKYKISERFFRKMEIENEDFIPDRYFYDYLTLDGTSENDEDGSKEIFKNIIDNVIQKHFEKLNDSSLVDSKFNEKEQSTLVSLNKLKISLIDNAINFNFYLQIVDILFSYLYDLRITEFEHNSESGWNINKISAVLSNFVDFEGNFFSLSKIPPLNYIQESLTHLLISSYRRVLIYPLYRNLILCEKIREDLLFVLNLGIIFILKCLLKIRSIFERCEPRDILNKIYIDYLIRWIQTSDPKIWKIITYNLTEVNINKNNLKLDLESIEEEFSNIK